MTRLKRIVKALEDAGVETRGVSEWDDGIIVIWLWGAVEVQVGRHEIRVERGGKDYETIYSELVREDEVVDCVKTLFERLRRKAAKKTLLKVA